ncbi:hypothetical protein, partial [Paraburkholderia ginsengiterrae]|uniref:hypothetical protein n=1 Tax=Paraburkholderia ginsengiterrae TaxID=1462993 RepID=UPI000A791BA4
AMTASATCSYARFAPINSSYVPHARRSSMLTSLNPPNNPVNVIKPPYSKPQRICVTFTLHETDH